jgi:hypothetical protein
MIYEFHEGIAEQGAGLNRILRLCSAVGFLCAHGSSVGESPLSFDDTRMRTPSRRMPTSPDHKRTWWAWALLGALLIGLGYWIYRQPYVLLFIAGLGVIVWIGMAFDTRHRRRLAASREGESICDFARSFERRRSDPWILRAVYDELSRFLSVDGRAIAVRRGDRCEKDLKIDPEDLDGLAVDIAFRARRSMDAADQNPLYGQVQSVGDIVTFLEHQPRIVEPCAAPNGGPAASIKNPNAPGGPPSVS